MKKNTRYNLLIAFTYSAVLIFGMFMGIKFIKMMGKRAQTINAVFLHPIDFVCWFKAANMINVANVDIKAMTRTEFHALHQIMVSLPKMMIKDCVHRNNYHDYLK